MFSFGDANVSALAARYHARFARIKMVLAGLPFYYFIIFSYFKPLGGSLMSFYLWHIFLKSLYHQIKI